MKLDLHVHTWYSNDGIHPPGLILKMAAKKGLQAIAVTDHNTVRGLREARRHAGGLTVIPGIEVDTIEGHLIGLGVETEIKPWLTAAETVELIKDTGAIVVLPHPFDYLRHGIGSRAKTLRVDAVEVMNSRSNIPFANTLARRMAMNMRSAITAGSDAHLAEDVGDSYLLIDEEENPTVETILKILTRRQQHMPKVVGRSTPLRNRIRKMVLQRLKKGCTDCLG